MDVAKNDRLLITLRWCYMLSFPEMVPL